MKPWGVPSRVPRAITLSVVFRRLFSVAKFCGLLAFPAELVLLLQPQTGEHAAAELGYKVINCSWPVVESRHDGENYGTRFLRPQHVAKVDAAKRRIAHGENQRASFLQTNIGRPLDQC